MSYRLQRVSADRIGDLQVLFKDAFNWRPSTEYLQRKYDTTRLGPGDLGYLSYAEDGVPAAYYGVFSARLNVNGTTVQGAQSGDTATHSQHRGKGLFTTLAQATYQLAAQEGVKVVYGFPNSNSYPGFVKKLNWTHTHDIDIFRIGVLTLPLSQAVYKWPVFKKLFNFWTRLFVASKKTDARFEGSVVAAGHSGVMRDEAYFDYKKSKDKHLVNRKGTLIWLKFDGYLWVGDMQVTTPERFAADLRWLKRIAFFTGCDKVVFQASPGSALHAAVSKIAKPSSTMHAGGVVIDPSFKMDLHSLYFTGADFDNW